LSDLFTLRGVSAYIRPDNGPEFVARAVQEWIAAVGAKTACIKYLFNDWHFEILFIVAIILGARPDDERIKERTNSWR
jgi:hypothetical protein